jgi:hypothetical protein
LIFAYFYDISQEGDKLPFVKVVIWTFMFVVVVSCVVEGIDYVTGSTITDVAGVITVVDNVTNYQNRVMFVFLAIVCAVGFATSLTDIKIPRWY